MKKIELLLVGFLIFSCLPEATEITEITPETSQISFSIAEITFNRNESTTFKKGDITFDERRDYLKPYLWRFGKYCFYKYHKQSRNHSSSNF